MHAFCVKLGKFFIAKMEVVLFSRHLPDAAADDIRQMMTLIHQYGLSLSVNREIRGRVTEFTGVEIPESATYDDDIARSGHEAVMVCYGGDGTFLEGVGRIRNWDIPVAGINAGHLGFLTMASRTEIGEVFRTIADRTFRIQHRSMLQICSGGSPVMDALNEISIQRLGSTMIAVDVKVDGDHVATYLGDGIIVSTPTGSTAYSLSAGGPVISPTCGAILVTPLASHHINMRPIVLPDSAVLSIRVSTRGNAASMSVDTRTLSIENGAEFTVRRSDRKISMVLPHNNSFFGALKEKLMWGIDIRKSEFEH